MIFLKKFWGTYYSIAEWPMEVSFDYQMALEQETRQNYPFPRKPYLKMYGQFMNLV